MHGAADFAKCEAQTTHRIKNALEFTWFGSSAETCQTLENFDLYFHLLGVPASARDGILGVRGLSRCWWSIRYADDKRMGTRE